MRAEETEEVDDNDDEECINVVSGLIKGPPPLINKLGNLKPIRRWFSEVGTGT